MNDEKRQWGCIKSTEDSRDWGIETVAKSINAAALPEEYRTEGKVKVLDQGIYSTCVAHAIATAMAYCEFKLGYNTCSDFSRGFIYANRRKDDWQGEGMMTRQALKNLNHDGDCLYESFTYNNTYPYCHNKLLAREKELKAKASPYKIVNYFRCYGELEVKTAIMTLGAVVVAMPVYKFGLHAEVQVPTRDDVEDGRHAMCCVGWDKTGWIIQNSWGKKFGNDGFCHIPYEYPIDEFWGITIKEGIPPMKKQPWIVRFGHWLAQKWLELMLWLRRKRNDRKHKDDIKIKF